MAYVQHVKRPEHEKSSTHMLEMEELRDHAKLKPRRKSFLLTYVSFLQWKLLPCVLHLTRHGKQVLGSSHAVTHDIWQMLLHNTLAACIPIDAGSPN